MKLFPHPQEDAPVGGVKLNAGLNGSSIQSIVASPNNSKEVGSEKIVFVTIVASEGIAEDGVNFI